MEITEVINLNFGQYNRFYKHKHCISFLILFSNRFSITTTEVNQIRSGSMSWLAIILPFVVHSTYFWNSKEVGFLQSKFPDYVCSCNYGKTDVGRKDFFMFLIYMRRIYSPMYSSFRGVWWTLRQAFNKKWFRIQKLINFKLYII